MQQSLGSGVRLATLVEHDRALRGWSYAELWRRCVSVAEELRVRPPQRQAVWQWCTGGRTPSDSSRKVLFAALEWPPDVCELARFLIEVNA